MSVHDEEDYEVDYEVDDQKVRCAYSNFLVDKDECQETEDGLVYMEYLDDYYYDMKNKDEHQFSNKHYGV
jgi:hypothetical protein